MPAPEAPRSSAPLASLEAQMTALRYDVALADLAHVTCLRVSGDDAYEALDAVCPADLVLRDGQMLHTLFLRDDGSPLCDVYVCRDDEEFWLLLEGQDGPSAAAHLRAAAPAGLRFDVRELDASHRSLLVSGPYAWELMGELVGPGIVGLPYLSFFLEGDWLCFRAGKTGEFGYHLLGPKPSIDAVEARLRELGANMGLGTLGQEALELAALENWFFNIRREGAVPGVTPLELQLQWRVSRRKEFPGAAALRERLQAGVSQRLTCFLADAPSDVGAAVSLGERVLGTVVNVAFSPLRGEWVGMALLERAFAHPGASYRSGDVALATVCPPVTRNRSIFLHLQRDSYRTRGERDFPPIR